MTDPGISSRSLPLTRIVALAAIGVWAGCILACRAAWSPDGKRIAFPFYVPSLKASESTAYGVAIHDVASGTTRLLNLAKPWSADDGVSVAVVGCRWHSDGKRILALRLFEEGTSKIEALVLDAESGEVLRRHVAGEAGRDGGQGDVEETNAEPSAPATPVGPIPLLDDRLLFLVLNEGLVRLDLETGERKVKGMAGSAFVMEVGDAVVLSRKIESAGVLEMALLDPQSLEPRPFLRLAQGPGADSWPVPAVDPPSGRLVITAKFEEAGKPGAMLLLFEGLDWNARNPAQRFAPVESPARVLEVAPRNPDDDLKLFDPVWRPGGHSVFAVYHERSDAPRVRAGICEIFVSGDPPRFFPLVEAVSTDPWFLSLSPSPDGKTLAALPLGVPRGGSESPFAPYLFLMDLTGSERAVKTIVAALPESASSSRKPEDSGTGGDKSADKPSDR